MLLNLDAGIFYEFIPAEEYFNDQPTRLSLEEVETDKNYALILNTDAGLWGYSIGDTVRFVSKDPYRLVVTGRIKHLDRKRVVMGKSWSVLVDLGGGGKIKKKKY